MTKVEIHNQKTDKTKKADRYIRECTRCGHKSSSNTWKRYENRCPMCGCNMYKGKKGI